MKVSHHDHQKITIFIELSKQKYEVEELNKLNQRYEKLHNYLWITLDFYKAGKAIVDMNNILKIQLNIFQWVLIIIRSKHQQEIGYLKQ